MFIIRHHIFYWNRFYDYEMGQDYMQNAYNYEPDKSWKAVSLRFVLVSETWNCLQAAN